MLEGKQDLVPISLLNKGISNGLKVPLCFNPWQRISPAPSITAPKQEGITLPNLGAHPRHQHWALQPQMLCFKLEFDFP